MVIGSPQKLRLCNPINLRLFGTGISRVETYKYLGVTLDSNLTWTAHTDELSKKMSSRIGLLKRVMPYLTRQIATLFFNTTISPLFDYCAVTWNSCNITASKKLQRLQNRAARVVLKSDNSLSSESALTQLNWSPLAQRRRFHFAIMLYKCLNNQTEGIDFDLIRHMDMHSYNTRRKEDFVLPKPKSNQLKKSFKYSATQIWNSLPVSLRNSKTLDIFKQDYKAIYFCWSTD